MHENKQFFDGFILGSLLMGILFSSAIIGTMIFQQGVSGKLPRIQADNSMTAQAAVESELTEGDLLTNETGTMLTIGGRRVQVVEALQNGQSGDIIRFLIAAGRHADGQNCYDILDQPEISVWDESGNRLIGIVPLTGTETTASSLCVIPLGFVNGNFAFVQKETTETGTKASFYLLDTMGSLDLAYQASSQPLQEGSNYPRMNRWLNPRTGTQLLQKLYTTDLASPVYYSYTGDTITRGLSIALMTSTPLIADVTTATNFITYEKGLSFTQAGQQQYIPWSTK